MPNTLLTPQIITRECLRVLHAELNFIKKVNRQYDSKFASSGGKIGASLDIRKPPRYAVQTGATFNAQDTVDTKATLTISSQKHVDVSFSSVELTLSLEDFSERIVVPAMSVLASSIEADALAGLYKTVPNQMGSSGSPLNSTRPVLKAKQMLADSLAPNPRHFLINTDSTVELTDAMKGLFNSQGEIAKQYVDGSIGRYGGFDFFENTLMPVHTTGVYGGTPQVTAAPASGATSITTKLWAATTTVLQKGDIITFDGVYAVHPETKATLGYLKQFVVTANTVTDGTGNSTINVYPAFVSTGAFQNISALPATNAVISVFSASSALYGINLAFHRDAFTFATADLEDVSKVGAWGARENFDGISMRLARQYAIGTDTVGTRIDVLYGYTALYPELACRVANQQSAT